jgi:thiamine-monophosphate kinase
MPAAQATRQSPVDAETGLIERLFAPLAAGAPGAAGLTDDVAEITAPGGRLIVTTDALVEGVHFLAIDPLAEVARKALRVNLSDLAGKGARATGYLLTVAWPDGRDPALIGEIAKGLGADQAVFGVHLLGGDTVRTAGPLMLSITAFGTPLSSKAPVRRSGGQAGDVVFVTGSIGDAGAGLALLRQGDDGFETRSVHRIGRYRRPLPRTAFAETIARHARAACDVSDGLLLDAARLARASGCAMTLRLADVPLSDALQRGARPSLGMVLDAARAGDDYEILFTAGPDAEADIRAEAQTLGLAITAIGRLEPGEALNVRGLDGARLEPGPLGWSHFDAAGR